MSSEAKLILSILIFIALLFIVPFSVVWALNTLFPVLAIAYTLETWAAVIVMGLFFRGNAKVKKG